MAAPPPGAGVQRRHRPTAAGLAVDGREPPGSLSVRGGKNPRDVAFGRLPAVLEPARDAGKPTPRR